MLTLMVFLKDDIQVSSVPTFDSASNRVMIKIRKEAI